MSFAIFDENYYLANNPDVQAAVNAGAFSSERQHFEQYGLAEGRVSVSPYYNEQVYLQKYSDVAAAVSAGSFRSGLQHYIQIGEAERRSPGAFDEQAYLALYPDVASAVAAGAFSSGVQHYIQFGQFEANRRGYFTGTTGNDTITGLGANTTITGIDVINPVLNAEGRLEFSSRELGAGDVDTLISGAGRDRFFLGSQTGILPETFYDDNGNADYALIQNFEPGMDTISLGGSSVRMYQLEAVNGNLNISTSGGDLIATVEGVTSLSEIPSSGTTLGDLTDRIVLLG
ncbi:hypothetical protein NIES593_21500 [Hydrococcus rivularis NIES-593]|uniref:Calcium-binding protein n=1 Tax=Hydrococcus rivularis NIES-593 TaxID=1921803 RepID=A0A1U7H863_9CYAN|nr:hypothetical protein [Hydrococcus rivularis]OKH18982.1 hypothetical protein NIES593_21500 [Hydrococcus rivularis NIES-593]